LSGVVTFDDFYDTQTMLFPQIAAQDTQFVMVVDMLPNVRLSLDIAKARLVFQRDQSLGTVIIGESKMWLFIGKTIQQLFPKARLQYVKTLAEGLEIARDWLGRTVLST
jgi:hypothetical protein